MRIKEGGSTFDKYFDLRVHDNHDLQTRNPLLQPDLFLRILDSVAARLETIFKKHATRFSL